MDGRPWMNYQQNSPLPAGWEARYDPGQSRYYFINHSTHETTWNDPRLAAWQFHQQQPTAVSRQPEHIQLQDMRGSSEYHGGASTSNPTQVETSITNVDDNDDEEWQNALLESALDKMKEPSFIEKMNMKDKLKDEFKELDDFEVENTLDSCQYDEEITRAILQSLKDELIRKREKERKEEEKKRKEKEEEARKKERKRKKEMERLMKEREEAEKAQEEMLRNNSGSPTSFSDVVITEAPRAIKTVSKTKVKAKKEKINRPKLQEKPPTTRPPSYISANRIPVTGPQMSHRKGPDISLLQTRNSSASGSNRDLAIGPSRDNYRGPSYKQTKPSLSKGPQRCLLQGAQRQLLSKQIPLTTAI